LIYSVALASLANGVMVTQAPQGYLIPLSSRQVYVYMYGTETQVPVYATAMLTGAPLTQPLTSGASGTPGALPGYVAAGATLDLVDVLTGNRVQAEALAGARGTPSID
jgi:hypothetical protein